MIFLVPTWYFHLHELIPAISHVLNSKQWVLSILLVFEGLIFLVANSWHWFCLKKRLLSQSMEYKQADFIEYFEMEESNFA